MSTAIKTARTHSDKIDILEKHEHALNDHNRAILDFINCDSAENLESVRQTHGAWEAELENAMRIVPVVICVELRRLQRALAIPLGFNPAVHGIKMLSDLEHVCKLCRDAAPRLAEVLPLSTAISSADGKSKTTIPDVCFAVLEHLTKNSLFGVAYALYAELPEHLRNVDLLCECLDHDLIQCGKGRVTVAGSVFNLGPLDTFTARLQFLNPRPDLAIGTTKTGISALQKWRVDRLSLDVSRKGETGAGDAPNSIAPIRCGPDFRFVHWHGTDYTFTAIQAACFKVMYEAFSKGTPDVGDATIIDAAGSAMNNPKLFTIFRDHPAWGEIIVEGATKGTHKLIVPEKK